MRGTFEWRTGHKHLQACADWRPHVRASLALTLGPPAAGPAAPAARYPNPAPNHCLLPVLSVRSWPPCQAARVTPPAVHCRHVEQGAAVARRAHARRVHTRCLLHALAQAAWTLNRGCGAAPPKQGMRSGRAPHPTAASLPSDCRTRSCSCDRASAQRCSSPLSGISRFTRTVPSSSSLSPAAHRSQPGEPSGAGWGGTMRAAARAAGLGRAARTVRCCLAPAPRLGARVHAASVSAIRML